MNTARDFAHLPALATDTHPRDIFRVGRDLAGGSVALACSFSIEDVVLIDLLHPYRDDFSLFAIDTGRLPEETFEVAESVMLKYSVKIDWYFPERADVETLERAKGLYSFRESIENRKECCRIRKIEPLQRALRGQAAWVTGQRREQSVSRKQLEPLETDELNGGLLKINPLAHWSTVDVWQYADQHRLPINRLHRQGYPSIGCAPCTRAIQPGEQPRAGRWWWEDPEHRECGLHRR